MLGQMIEEHKQDKEQLAEMKALEIKTLEQKVFERFDQEAAARKELEKRVLALADLKVNGLRADIARESKLRYESIEHLENCLEVRRSGFKGCRTIFLSCRRRSGLSLTTGRNWTTPSSRKYTKSRRNWLISYRWRGRQGKKLKSLF